MISINRSAYYSTLICHNYNSIIYRQYIKLNYFNNVIKILLCRSLTHTLYLFFKNFIFIYEFPWYKKNFIITMENNIGKYD